jgi:hypothetical protein
MPDLLKNIGSEGRMLNLGTVRCYILLASMLAILGCASTEPSRFLNIEIKKGEEAQLRSTKALFLRQFICQDTIISRAIKNLVIAKFLPTDIKISNDSATEVKVDVTITSSADFAGGGNAVATGSIGSSAFSSSGGGYVSGITAQLVKNGNVLASVNVSQSRNNSGIPDPPEVLAGSLGDKLVCLLTDGHCGY